MILGIDRDGTLLHGTEQRNRIVLQEIFNKAARENGITTQLTIDWGQAAGKTEPDIHNGICTQVPAYGNVMNGTEFQTLAKNGYRTTPANLDPREGMLDLIKEWRELGHPSIMVTNSEKEEVVAGFEDYFGSDYYNDVDFYFSGIVVTKTDVLAAELEPKPSGDPYLRGMFLYNRRYKTNYGPEDLIAVEDSGSGVLSGYRATGNDKNRIIQFTEMTPASPYAGFHVDTTEEFADAVDFLLYEKNGSALVVA